MPTRDVWPEILFWLGHSPPVGSRVTLDEVESHHLARVLRRRVGDPIVLADGAGAWLDARVIEIRHDTVMVEVTASRPSPAEPSAGLHLGFPVLRGGRTELLLEKCTEIGVTRFTPIRFAHTGPAPPRDARWGRVVRAAAMQSLRSRLPELAPLRSLREWTSELDQDALRLVATPGGGGLPEGVHPAVAAIVGPEGDLSAEEHELLREQAFVPIGLGARRLRAETAAIALVTLASAARDPARTRSPGR
jgi:16S rRNA (uracil1498-N3)-methyltransferase